LQEIARRVHQPRPITPGDIDAWKKHRRELYSRNPAPTSQVAENRRPFVDEMTFPETHPVLAGVMLVDARGNVWLPHADPLDEFGWSSMTPPNWSVFSPEGRWLGEVRMPDRFRPMDIGETRALGVMTDPLGVEYVVRFDLIKP
jgi:hypothetical protein